MLFQDYLMELSTKRQGTVREKLGKLARKVDVNRQMYSNLFAEERFSRRDCKILCRFLLCRHLVNSAQTQRLIRELSRKGRSLRGEAAKVDTDTMFFRVVTLDRLAALLYAEGFHGSEDEAMAFIEELIGAEPEDLAAAWGERPLAKHLMWSSFLLSDESSTIDVSDISSYHLLCSLGLEPETGPLLLLQYRLPEGCTPRIPAFWDAYASDPWNLYFRVSPRGDPYGLTMPTEGCPREARPEVVHEVIEAKDIIEPLKYAQDGVLENVE